MEISAKGKIAGGFIMVMCWFALVVQFLVMIGGQPSSGVSMPESIARFFSYFTIQSNILVALTLTFGVFAPATVLGKFFSRLSVRTAVAVYIAIVGVVYTLLLRLDLEGWHLVADRLLHDAVPLTFVIFWLIFVPKGGLQWKHAIIWLIYPLAYMAYSLARGAFADWYPYFFVDVTQLGYPVALRNAAFVVAAFVLFGLVFIAVDKLLGRNANNTAT